MFDLFTSNRNTEEILRSLRNQGYTYSSLTRQDFASGRQQEREDSGFREIVFKENDDNYVAIFDVSDIIKEDIAAELIGHNLTIVVKENKEDGFTKKLRSVYLACPDKNNIKASIDNNLLTIVIGKKEDVGERTKISIE